ncbi:MAG: hypothetical protein A3F67_00635 [Verrucomicrobia bacterium RIFCSPHIGHO2_12_FULL_41_10]|nr:MAG: hypothetical protein A3F67_00635 [Verrucomicrobia bacterium RIFCSPHIGHO2_12_FULL_41_10]HLB34174.1 hypothetical protein [Chthoniobacterales bacterium]
MNFPSPGPVPITSSSVITHPEGITPPIHAAERQPQQSLTPEGGLPLLQLENPITRTPQLESSYNSSFVSKLDLSGVSTQERPSAQNLASLIVKTEIFLQAASHGPIEQSSEFLSIIQKYLNAAQQHYKQYGAPYAPGAAIVRGYSGNLGAVKNYLALVSHMKTIALTA